MTRRSLLISTVLLIVISVSLGQQTTSGEKNLESTLQKLSMDAAIGYVGPIVSGFGSDLNAGWFHRAPRAKLFGFDVEFGIVAMGTLFSDENKTFSVNGVVQFDSSQSAFLVSNINDPMLISLPPAQREQAKREIINQIRGRDFSVGISGPTIIGSDLDSVRIDFQGGQFTFTDPLGNRQSVTVPSTVVALPVVGLLGDKKILGKNMIPLAAPQASIGTILGTQVTFRYLPEVEISAEVGKFKYFGFGIQHNPGLWLSDDLPFDVSGSYFTQKLQAGSIFEARTTAFGINASKRIGWGFLNLTPYAGFMLEKSTMTFTYDYVLDTPTGLIPQKIRFELEGENRSRLTLGLSVKILLVNVNADYNFGRYNSVSAGVMIII